MEDDIELIEGKLALKLDARAGIWRHCIQLADGTDQDIHYTDQMQICMGAYDNDAFKQGEWLTGRYEATLGWARPRPEEARAALVIGEFYPDGREIRIEIPLNALIRVKSNGGR
jgi:hypothetical protein